MRRAIPTPLPGPLTRLKRSARSLGVGVGMLLLAAAAVRGVIAAKKAPPPRKAPPVFQVALQQPPPVKPPPPPEQPPKEMDAPETNRVDVNPIDVPPDAPPPSPSEGPLAMATTGDGPGDAFGLVGNPGGRSLTSGAFGLGDGQGSGLAERIAWYASKAKGVVEGALQRSHLVRSDSIRLEMRIVIDDAGRIVEAASVRPTGDERIEGAIRSLVGLKLSEPPTAEIPRRLILRIIVRRPT